MSPQIHPPEISVLIVSYNSRSVIARAITSALRALGNVRGEIIVVDNNSSDGTADYIQASFPQVRLIRIRRNTGFARGCLKGYEHSSGEFVVLLNPDAEFDDAELLAKLLAVMKQNANVGIAVPVLRNRDLTIQNSVRYWPRPKELILRALNAHSFLQLDEGNYLESLATSNDVITIPWAIGAFMVIRRRMIDEIGFLDPEFTMYFEDLDYFVRAWQAGWKAVCVPEAAAFHDYARAHRRKMFSRLFFHRIKSAARFYRKHRKYLREVRRSGGNLPISMFEE